MGSARLSSELHASPSQSTTSPSIPSVCLHLSHRVITGPVAFPFMILPTQIASKSASKPEKRTLTQSLQKKREAKCCATVAHGAEKGARHWRHRTRSELQFFFSSVLLPQKETEGAGINHADDCAAHNEQCLLENWGFLKQTGENV